MLAAHPDDEVLGCGGTIACRTDQGEPVTIAILGEGITSREDVSTGDRSQLLEKLRLDAREAARILGVSDVRFFGLPDNRFDTVSTLEVVKIIERLIEEVQPEVVFTQHGGDLNVDHQCVFRATLTACRPGIQECVKALYAYEVASSTEWAFAQFAPAFQPTYFVDVSRTLARKLDAMEAYRSEIRQAPHPRSREVLSAAAVRWGSVIGCQAAEPFAVVFHRDMGVAT